MKGLSFHQRVVGGAFALLLLLQVLAGCSGPEPVPVSQRAPGKDITAEERADKRGDVKIPPANGG